MIVYQLTIWTVLALLLQTVLPVLIDLVTTTVTRNGLKTVLLGLLTIAVTLATGLENAHETGRAYDLLGALMTAGGGFAVSLAAYYKIWKRTGISAAAQRALVTAPLPPDPADPAPLATVTALRRAS